MILVSRALIAFLPFLINSPSFANETVSNIPVPRESVENLQNVLDRRVAKGSNQIEKELNCARERLMRQELTLNSDADPTNNVTPSLLSGDQAHWDCMLKNLSPHMLRSFEKFKLLGNDIERALFLSHVVVESGGFQHFSETKSFQKYQCVEGLGEGISAGNTLMTQVIVADQQDSKFGKGSGAGSWSMGSNRGFGPIQITGCSNRLSVIHYLNQFYRDPNLTPTWRENWTYGRDGEKQIMGNCTESQRNEFIISYGVSQEMNANLYGAFHDAGNLGLVGGTVNDPVTNLKPSSVEIPPMTPLSSTEFMFDASLAYWKGRNQELISNLSSPQDLYTSECKEQHYRGERDDWQSLAVRCSTRRIRGLTANQKDLLDSSTKTRTRYFRELAACMQ